MKNLAGFVLGLFLSGCSLYDKFSDLNPVDYNSQTVQATQQSIPRKSLEESLFEDAEDGKLDMNFERALLIASGCEDVMVEFYKREIDVFLKEVIDSVSERDAGKRARLIAKEIKNKTKYKLFEYRFHYLANKGIRQGNCLGLTILFNLACERDGIKSGYACTFSHAFPYVEISGKRMHLDLTTETLEPEKSDLEDEFLYSSFKLDILAQIYCIKGAGMSKMGRINEAREVYNKGLRIWPKNKHLLENLVRGIELLNDEQAGRDIDRYISAYPELPQIYAYKARILLRLKKYEEAVSCLNKSLEIKKDAEIEDWIREIREEHLNK
ncbi:MAG: hypothetical protein KKE50_06400 [Nanoarchaeota archaeon]|nr:hypothetical protein [Nanoarchaeota archaeon]